MTSSISVKSSSPILSSFPSIGSFTGFVFLWLSLLFALYPQSTSRIQLQIFHPHLLICIPYFIILITGTFRLALSQLCNNRKISLANRVRWFVHHIPTSTTNWICGGLQIYFSTEWEQFVLRDQLLTAPLIAIHLTWICMATLGCLNYREWGFNWLGFHQMFQATLHLL